MPVKDAEGARLLECPLDHIFPTQDLGKPRKKPRSESAAAIGSNVVGIPDTKSHVAKILSATALVGRQDGGKTVGTMVGWSVYGQHFQEITQRNLESNFNRYSRRTSVF